MPSNNNNSKAKGQQHTHTPTQNRRITVVNLADRQQQETLENNKKREEIRCIKSRLAERGRGKERGSKLEWKTK